MGSNHMNELFRNSKNVSKRKKMSSEYFETRKNEIPMYDPQSGEPNPHYEELTGNKNPLLEQKNDLLTKMPFPYEPKRKNLWVLNLPEEMGINTWVVHKTNRPSFKIKEKKILGFTYSKKIVWSEITIEFYDPIGPSTSQVLMRDFNVLKPFDYTLEMLDPTGVVIEKWSLNGCKLKSIDFCEITYENDGLVNIKMVLKPKNVILMY
jgi:hypothetical protein